MEILALYNAVVAELESQIKDVIGTPIFWILIVLLLFCFISTYNGSTQSRLTNSLVNTIRLFGTFLIDNINSIVLAFQSLFGFLDAVRLLMFGHLGRSTLYVLANYAIIFLSLASFITTFQGLSSLIGWIGFLVSFGIQVTELLSVTGIVICWVPPKNKPKENVTYKYCSRSPEDENTPPDDSWGMIKAPEVKKTWFKWGRVKRLLLPVALLFAYIASVFFSYCYIFNAIVMPEIAYDDYIESIDLVNQETERYEDALTLYRTELVRGLTRFLDDVSTQSRLSEQNLSTIDEQIQSRERDEVSLTASLDTITNTLAGMDQDSEARTSLEQRQRTIMNELYNVQNELNQLRTTRSSPEYSLYRAIRLLTQYLADPLYLYRSDSADEAENSAASEQELNNALNTVMLQGYAPYSEEISVAPEQIRTAFNNYTLLCRYYAAHNSAGLNLSGTGNDEDSLDTLLSQRASIMAQYNALRNPEEVPEDGVSLQDAADYLNKETGKLLIAAMRAIEEVPRFSIVGELWAGGALTGTGGIYPKEPDTAGHLKTLNEKYRASNGQLSLQERAISKLFSENSTVARFALAIALGLDLMIISLCLIRGREYYANSVRNRRQMISLLFVVSNTEEERRQNEEGRLVILAGAVLGCLTYLLYFKFSPDAANGSAITALILIMGGIMLVSFLQSLRHILKIKPKKDGDKEDPIQERISPKAYNLFSCNLNKAFFRKRCTIRKPKEGVMSDVASYYARENNIWREMEEHKIRLFTLAHKDYNIITTSESVGMEYYVLESAVKTQHLKFQFAVLQSFSLIHSVMVPATPQTSGTAQIPVKQDMALAVPTALQASEIAQAPEAENMVPAYLLPREFIRLLYECVLLRTVMGSNWDYTLEDDMLDYEQEEDNED